jgi:hypothetical protein
VSFGFTSIRRLIQRNKKALACHLLATNPVAVKKTVFEVFPPENLARNALIRRSRKTGKLSKITQLVPLSAALAGVSVGTLYQYYPNKQSLLFAVFEDHPEKVSRAVEAACADACHKPMSEMIRRVVDPFVDVKMRRADISVPLYKVAPDAGGPILVKRTGQRLRKAIKAMLLTAPGLELSPDRSAIDMMLSAMSGAMRSALEAGASPAIFRKV